MMKKIKLFLYNCKTLIVGLFRYPTLRVEKPDYDMYWDERRGETLGGLSDWQKERADITCELLKSYGPVSVLDFGCGDGAVLKYLKDKGVVTKAYGSEISEKAKNIATKNGLEMIALDEGEKTFDRAPAVDTIFFFEVLEHIPNSEVVLAAAKKHARLVIFSVPNTGFIAHRLRLLFGRFPLQWAVNSGEHVRFWTLRDMRWWLKSQEYSYTLVPYRGVPLLNKLMPALFAEGVVVLVY